MWFERTKNLLVKLAIELPIIQAPMAGGATTPALVAAVSNAGGLGSIGAGYLSPNDIRIAITGTRALTNKPFSVNLFVTSSIKAKHIQVATINRNLDVYRKELHIQQVSDTADYVDLFKEQLAVVLEEKVPVFSFTFGIPSPEAIKILKDNNVIIMGTATTVNEGLQLENKGCDIIVAQGSEAGGHRGSFAGGFRTSLIGTMAFIPQLVDAVKIPVVAAGGIMDGRGLAASLILGASAVQMGTAFLTCPESGIHKKYKLAILDSTEESTVVTSVFSGKPARGIKNRFIEEMEVEQDNVADYPIQNTLTQDIRKEAAKQNRTEFMSLWAGQGTRLSKEKFAADFIESVISEAKKILNTCSRNL
jgi:nitronate monooxygenase